ncbi:MAG: glycosyltransferase family 2 protein [Dehalococcoidia bacterium]|nr:glycosyltransferase family 2 protein [Dehalococcoidia bacterium]
MNPPGAAASAIARTPQSRVVVVPVYNERESVRGVLEQIESAGFTSILVVDDGSTDGSAAVLDEWAATSVSGRVIHLPRNQGKSKALQTAWERLRTDRGQGLLDDDTIVINVDADGQHDLGYLDALIAQMEARGADAIIARRDFSYHGWYKRLGNGLMTALGSMFSGRRMHDIESGYRIMRLGPLIDTQEFYAGRRYSECVEFAVVSQRLGYRVDNDFLVHVPVLRTNTRLKDAASHVVLMALAWYRVVCWRGIPRSQRSRAGACLAALLVAAFGTSLTIVLAHTIYLGNDSAQSYGHVWFIEHSLRSGHGIPLRVPYLDSGHALTFPYGVIPWLPAALLRPLLGDWAVTASMVLGVLLLLYGVSKWLPKTASPIIMAVVLLNWQLWNGILQFQLPTIWALALAALAAAAFNRGRARAGTVLAAAALISHPLMGIVGLALTLLAHIEVSRRISVTRVAWLVGAAVIASPVIWTFFQIPAIEHVGRWGWGTLAQITLQRTSMLWWPWLCQQAILIVRRWHVPMLLLGMALLARNYADSNPQNARWESLPRFPDFIAAGLVDPDARYRVLTMSNQEDGMVQLIQASAILAQNFFDESVERRSFDRTDEYRCFLVRKGASDVLVQGEWTHRILRDTSNEVQMLNALVSEGHATLAFRGFAGTLHYVIEAPPVDMCPGAR